MEAKASESLSESTPYSEAMIKHWLDISRPWGTCSFSWFLVNDQREAQILLYVFISIYNSLHVSSTSFSSSW